MAGRGEELEATNRKRKAEQITAGETLRALEQQFQGYVHKNNELHLVCMELEQQVKKLKSLAKKSKQ